jgi:hypothetical protein
MQKLDPHERAAILRRIVQIEHEREFPRITAGQKEDLEREEVILVGKIQQDNLLE